MNHLNERVRHHFPNILLFLVIVAWYVMEGGLFGDQPPAQRAFNELACILWLSGLLVLVRSSHLRVRRTGGPSVRAFVLPFFYFNKREWLTLLALFTTVATFAAIGMALDPSR